jgi:hypothetical protein
MRVTTALVRPTLRLALIAAAGSGLACGGGDDNPGPDPNTPTLQEFIAGVASGDGSINATFVGDAPPAEGSGPSLTLSTNGSVIPGGSTLVSLTGSQQFNSVIVAVDGETGYYRLTLPAASPTAELLVTLAQSLPGTSLDWQFGAGTGTSVGPYTTSPVNVVRVGTGDVQVTLSWNTAADVDLHVVDPSGEEIYYANTGAASGGQLDLDSNAACESDGPRNENITWPTNGAPNGTYRVLVDYWDNCDATSTDYSVTVQRRGASPQTFTGTLTGEGDQGGAGAGQQITTFTVGAAVRASASAAARVYRLGTASVSRRPGAAVGVK